MNREHPRVAVIDGVRTPFAKRRGALSTMPALDLGTRCTSELLQRNGLDGHRVDQIVYGRVVGPVGVHNIAREIGLRCDLPPTVEAYTVARACATSYQALVCAAHAIRCGDIETAIVGGADSASHVPVTVTERLVHALEDVRGADNLKERVQALSGLRLDDLAPEPPALAEPSTGEIMGEGAERMAKLRRISRRAQDEYAHRSHERAAAAWRRGDFDYEVMSLFTREGAVLDDECVRHDSSLESYGKLRPVFDEHYGTITAANASPLSDGASAILLMAEHRAEHAGLEPLGYVESHAFSAVDPRRELLIGPVEAIPVALERADAAMEDMAVVDIHEAFAAQTLAVLEELDERGMALDPARLNVGGGSIALGHPFAATGARQITQTLNELRRRGGGRGLCAACAAGGLAAAVVLEAA